MNLEQFKNRRTQTVLSLVVASLLVGTAIGRFVMPVEVTNFPLDEEGNLRVSTEINGSLSKDFETFVLFSNEPLPYPSGLESATINVTQYKTLHLFIKTTATTDTIIYFHHTDPQTSETFEIEVDRFDNYGKTIKTYMVLGPEFHIHLHPSAHGTVEAIVYATTP